MWMTGRVDKQMLVRIELSCGVGEAAVNSFGAVDNGQQAGVCRRSQG